MSGRVLQELCQSAYPLLFFMPPHFDGREADSCRQQEFWSTKTKRRETTHCGAEEGSMPTTLPPDRTSKVPIATTESTIGRSSHAPLTPNSGGRAGRIRGLHMLYGPILFAALMLCAAAVAGAQGKQEARPEVAVY